MGATAAKSTPPLVLTPPAAGVATQVGGPGLPCESPSPLRTGALHACSCTRAWSGQVGGVCVHQPGRQQPPLLGAVPSEHRGSPLPRAMPSEYRQPRCVAGAGASAREEQGGRIGAGKRLGASGGVEVGGWSQRGWRVGPLRRDPRRRRWPTTPLPNSVKHAQTTYEWKRGEGAGGGRGHPTTRTQVPTGAGGKSAGARRTAHPSGAMRRLPSRAPCVSWRAVVAARLGRLPAVLMRELC